MNILITGASSFIGQALAEHLAAAGHTVSGTFNSPTFAAVPCRWLAKRYRYQLGGAIECAMFESIDLVLHLAHDFRPGTSEATIRGSKELFRAARQRGVPRQMFCSSCSARNNALSEYGRTKYALERYFREEGAMVVRPGLVLGKGGVYKRMAGLLNRLPIIPLPDRGSMVTPVIDDLTLCQSVTAIIAAPPAAASIYNLFHPQPVTLARLLRLTADALDRHPLFVPLPAALLMLPLLGLARLGIPTPISVDNLQGLLMNKSHGEPSDLGDMVPDLPAVDEMIRRAAARCL